jgi:hemoglobin
MLPSSTHEQEHPVSQPPLFDRLGGRDGIRTVVEKSVANHLANPIIKTRFEHASQTEQQMVDHAVEFFCTGLSGVETYTGRSLPDAHAGMNIADEEFVAAIDDILDAMRSSGAGEQEQSEVLGILYGMKSDVVRK